SLAMCTPLAPVIGYDKAAEIAKTAYKEGKTVRQVAREKSGLSEKELDEIFNLRQLTEPGIRGKGGE
ncbi:MAG: aspartate ammonia-lyase, partial [Verrucomicrobiota bacterium]